tara:strand:+ start:1449 stop:1601 length:153 start_codon:yes stop_codon:yes gene_type:complete
MAVFGGKMWIPENNLGIPEGHYDNNEIVTLLRMHCERPEVIYYIADMMEE